MEKSVKKTVLEEGRSYPFKITGSVVLPDGTDCFILSDINQVKHLLYKEYYTNYNLQLNQQLICRIDKINCTGKIFIEPEHPYYKLGSSYTFSFEDFMVKESHYGEAERLAILKNGCAEDIYLAADEIERPLKKGEKIEAVVERIKKGKVFLTLSSSINDYTGMEAGKKYHFTLTGEFHGGGRYACYLLTDDSGKEFRIRKKFYEKYGFKMGDLISCELVETDHQVYLEPVHPFYEIGFNYEFNIKGETLINEYPYGQVEAYLLENKYGKDAVVPKSEVSPRSISGNTIKCTVTEIKKSQVILACL